MNKRTLHHMCNHFLFSKSGFLLMITDSSKIAVKYHLSKSQQQQWPFPVLSGPGSYRWRDVYQLWEMLHDLQWLWIPGMFFYYIQTVITFLFFKRCICFSPIMWLLFQGYNIRPWNSSSIRDWQLHWLHFVPQCLSHHRLHQDGQKENSLQTQQRCTY